MTHSSLETFLSSRFVEPADRRSARRPVDDAFLAHQPRDVLLPVLARVLADDALHGRVGFQRRGIDAPPSCPQAGLLVGHLEHEAEHLLDDLQRQSAADSDSWSDRASLRAAGCPGISRAQAVGTPPGDASLRVDALEVADEQHAEVDARRNGALSARLVLVVVGRQRLRSSDRSSLRRAAR